MKCEEDGGCPIDCAPEQYLDPEDCPVDVKLVRAMIAGEASCSFCGNRSEKWMECGAHKTENPYCICAEFEWQPKGDSDE